MLKLAVFGNYREIEIVEFQERIFRYVHALRKLTFFDLPDCWHNSCYLTEEPGMILAKKSNIMPEPAIR